MGISTSRLCDRRAYRGRIDGEYRMRAPSVASRSRTRGWRTATGPMPVMISRSGRWPWRTTRCWPVSVLRSLCFARNSATSASTAWVSSARAPLRRISVRQSLKAPGWASLMTLLSDTAYHSFIGEVEALNTTTIRRLTRSRRHQLLVIAPVALDQGQNDRLLWDMVFAVCGLAADECLVSLNHLVLPAEATRHLSLAHCLADAVHHEPSGFIAAAHHAVHLKRRHAFLTAVEQVYRHAPLVERDLGALANSVDRNRELLATIVIRTSRRADESGK